MNKTIKIIDLLNKNANGKNVPKKIKYKNIEYTYSSEICWYRRIDDIGSYDEWFISINRLNDVVEIIEEDINIQDIEELDEHFSLKYINSGLKKETEKEIDETVNRIYYRINELIKAVKELDRRIK